ncbi:MAG: hypothetical protein R3D65_18045 [Zhengella sp.]|uniref:hypothetical protein n=1 Tax=Zhengella sp. TaxID=2282762 RepID=UPI0035289FB0
MKDSIGIDISKAHLDVCRPATGQTARFENSAAGLTAFKRWVGSSQPDLVIYEATGLIMACLRNAALAICPW